MNLTSTALPDLRQLAAQYWGEGKHSGSAVVYRSRWRTDDIHPSFAVYADGFKDFGGSGESGNVVQWVMREFGYSYSEARQWLEKQYNYYHNNATQRTPHSVPESSRHKPPSLEWQRYMRDAIRETQHLLWTPIGKRALAYLREHRKLSDETIRAAGLGYASDYVKTGFAYDSDNSNHRNRYASIPPGIVIPWEVDGTLWAIRVRSRVGTFADALSIPEDRFTYGDRRGEVVDKYLSARGSRPGGVLYGADNIIASKKVVFFEGEFDALLAQQHLGEQTTCVTFGSASNVPSFLSDVYLQRLEAYNPVYTVMDADSAGQSAESKLHKLFPKSTVHLSLPAGFKDITEYAQSGGDIHAWFAHAAIEGVPDSVITGLLHLKDSDSKHLGSAAPVYYTLTLCANEGLLKVERFTQNELLTSAHKFGIKLHYDLIRDGLRVLLDNQLLVRIGSESTLSTDPNSAKNPTQESQRDKNGGRPSDIYRLVSSEAWRVALGEALAISIRERAYPVKSKLHQPATVADLESRAFTDVSLQEDYRPEVEVESIPAKTIQRFERKAAFRYEKRLSARLIGALSDSTATPFPEGWAMDTLRLFRIAYLRALKLANRVGSSLEEVSNTIGISRDSVNKYVEMSGFRIERDQSVAVVLHANEPIEQQVRRAAMQVRGKPVTLEIEMPISEEETLGRTSPLNISRVPYTSAAAYSALQHGKKVQIRYQTANLHIPIPNARPYAAFRYKCRLQPKSNFFDSDTKQLLRSERRLDKEERERAALNLREEDPIPNEDQVAERPSRRAGYSPEWVEGQIRLRLELLGFLSKDGSRYISPKTGEVIPYFSSLESLVRLLIGRSILHETDLSRACNVAFDV